jgi:hypothetical protein
MVRYKMIGRDVNSSPTQYRTWIVNNTPDFDGYYYTGLKSGLESFVDVSTYQINDGYAVVDFNFPLAQNWSPAFKTMPTVDGYIDGYSSIHSSQLAIIDGYCYLFGGEGSSEILRASTSNPTDWIYTGFNLPDPLSGSSLSIIDGYIYLMGGKTTSGSTNHIYRAQTSNPLSWIYTGSNLPGALHKSQLVDLDGYVYLFGGKNGNLATNVIYKAPRSNPLSWTNTGATLPDNLYESQVAILDNRIHLFGGFTQENVQTNRIYSALKATPTTWTVSGILPFPCGGGQFVVVANKGYLFTEGSVVGAQPYLTKILRCDISSPTVWQDTLYTVPGNITQSQLGIVNDRLYLFGGNGISAIFLCDQQLKYDFSTGTPAAAYGSLTRTQYNATIDSFNLFKLLGFPAWKTNYGRNL